MELENSKWEGREPQKFEQNKNQVNGGPEMYVLSLRYYNNNQNGQVTSYTKKETQFKWSTTLNYITTSTT